MTLMSVDFALARTIDKKTSSTKQLKSEKCEKEALKTIVTDLLVWKRDFFILKFYFPLKHLAKSRQSYIHNMI